MRRKSFRVFVFSKPLDVLHLSFNEPQPDKMHFNSATGDISRAILKVTQSKDMSLIENKWFNRRISLVIVLIQIPLIFHLTASVIFDEKDIGSHTFKSSAVHNVSSPITQCTPSHLTLQIRPWPRSMSLSREFELRKACFVMSEERFRTQPKHDKVGVSDIESGAE
ncbi:hypothetical protein HID58_062494 [Brassica napus]|uniref:Uncharacterized protein n=1 Tax=Brassica napus TaxID=3708 RepID=A0ABQ8A1R3_BRANA|nr:hypothetical protein HID58_062494 [Brassica napus]